jgi:Ca2+-binding RTX toxin-like protein
VSLDASAVTGVVTVTVDGTTDGMESVTTGSAADVITIFAASASGDAFSITTNGGADTVIFAAGVDATINGGTGTDKIRLNDGVDISSSDITLTSIEQIELVGGGTTQTVAASWISGVTYILAEDGSGTANLTISMDQLTVDLSSLGAASSFASGTDFITIDASGLGLSATITGSGSDDVITGSGVADVITSGDGADTITGGSGGDIMTGGLGADTFTFTGTTALLIAAEAGSTAATDNDFVLGLGDKITDFVSGTDTLNFAAALVTSALGTEVDTLKTIAAAGTVADTDRFVEITTAAGDGTMGTAVTLLNALTTTAVAIGDSFIAFINDGTDGYLYLVQQASAANTIIASDVTLIGQLTGVTDIANGDLVSF